MLIISVGFLIGLVILIMAFLLSAVALYLSTKLFNLPNAFFKTAFKIVIWQAIWTIIISLIIWIASLYFKVGFLQQILFGIGQVILLFLIFHFLAKKYYLTGLVRNIALYIVFAILEIILTVVISLLIVLPIRFFITEPFYVKGAAMEPNLVDLDYILLNKMDKNYQRGEVVVFRYPKDERQYFIKRIIGLPNEKVIIKEGKVYIVTLQNPEGYLLAEPYLLADNLTPDLGQAEFILGPEEYFVLGDSRQASLDSRKFGPVKKDLIIGKYWLKLPYKF